MSDFAVAATGAAATWQQGSIHIVLSKGGFSKIITPIAAKVSRSIDTIADGWTATIPWAPGKDPELDSLLQFYSYAKAEVYLGNRLVNTGMLFAVENDLADDGLKKNLEGAAYTANLVDVTVQPSDGHANLLWTQTSLLDFCKVPCALMGIEATATDQVKTGTYADPFPMIQCHVTDKWGDVISRLAFQRAMLATNDVYGNLLLWAATATGTPVATLRENEAGCLVTAWKIKQDGRKRFGTYIVYGQDSFGSQIQSQTTDPAAPAYRVEGVTAGELGQGNIQITAEWKKNTQLIQALTIPLPVTDWYTADNTLWSPNQLVTVIAPSLGIPRGFTFLIRSVVHNLTDQGRDAVLSLVPPSMYTNNPLQEPWSNQ